MPSERLSARLRPVYDAFILDLREKLGRPLADKLDFAVVPDRGGLTLHVGESGLYPFDFLDADAPGGVDEVARDVVASVAAKRPRLVQPG
jgi:hypothetical protein